MVSPQHELVAALEDVRRGVPLRESSWQTIRDYLSGMVRPHFRRRLRSKLDESDIVQESLIDAQRDAKSMRGETPHAIMNWMMRLLHNNLVDADRRYAGASCRSIDRETSFSPSQSNGIADEKAMTASDIFVKDELDAELARAVAQLTANEQELLRLRHQLGWTFVIIGNHTGISEQAARKRWNRIIEKLRKELASRGGSSA